MQNTEETGMRDIEGLRCKIQRRRECKTERGRMQNTEKVRMRNRDGLSFEAQRRSGCQRKMK